jgi:hypothetical protein
MSSAVTSFSPLSIIKDLRIVAVFTDMFIFLDHLTVVPILSRIFEKVSEPDEDHSQIDSRFRASFLLREANVPLFMASKPWKMQPKSNLLSLRANVAS